ncbi:LuxR C-terminal-related transcriptional regulator [Streptomyces cylindrosporus]|uniref:LuxR C-terminal-related transcriptional regulator n=1 Tax=Streptomyces cylindrosporus TaxID=2927583 RepID=A0ABS9Y9H2_9ACTN|nr:LuxR C-terminal-related transcriptional regulator [Streptomyces cylindrosporus]MCI3273873.1 LuxR C-terminal-related transcriptional regulator [Streptomyces cylindrosporus]
MGEPTGESRTPDGGPLLAARFGLPAVPRTFVRRPRLIARLTQGVRRPVTLVNGSAGAGKTLLVADWTTGPRVPRRIAWLTVEAEDNSPGVFWTYVLEALRRRQLAGSDDGVGTPARSGEVDHSMLARLAALLSRQQRPVVLVLDEFERVAASAEIADELNFVLRHSGGGLRLVVISRTEPLLPLHRYRAAGEAVDIRGADLAFLPRETAELLDRHGMSLSDEGVRALTTRTGGWAAGLRLSILAAQQAEDPEAFLKEFEAGQSTLADFLLAEVLDAQPPETQDLLLRASILEQIRPELADVLTGRDDAAPILDELQHANAFVESLGHSTYRLHPLFAEILRVHLRVRRPGLEPVLHRTAAQWLSGAGLPAEALPHAADAGDWEFAATLFVEELAIGRLRTGLEVDRLDRLFSRMPPEASGPAVDLVRAARELARHDIDRGLRHLRRVESRLGEEDQVSAALRLSCATLRVLAARMTGSADEAEAAAQDAEAARPALPQELVDRHPELPALMLTDLGSAQLWEGRFDAARATLSAAAGVTASPVTASPRHESLGRLALIDFLRGWPARAERHAREAVAQAERSGLPPTARTGVAQLVLAAVAIDRDELGEARGHLDRAAAASAALHDPIVTTGLTLLRSRLRLAGGDPQAALRALEGLDQDTPAIRPSPWVHDRAVLTVGASHLAAGRPLAALEVFHQDKDPAPENRVTEARAMLDAGQQDAALELLDELPTGPGEGPAVTVRALLVRAQAAELLGNGDAAARLIARALFVARPEGLRRPFLETGPWLRRLLHRRPELVAVHDWLPATVRGELPRDRSPAELIEPLSRREHEILERLAQLMSTEEIAEDIHLSVNTVKTHLKSIYRKLGAGRRGEAVRRARELHVL